MLNSLLLFNCRVNMIDIITIAICAIICGAEKWTQIAEFGRSKYEWFSQFLELPNGTPSHDKSNNKAAIHMVSAFCVQNGMVLGQVKTDEKSNEITAIPELIKLLRLKALLSLLMP
jgi:predicted transposase YbfD/YdcC